MHGAGESPQNGKLEFEPGLSHWLASPTDRKKLREKSILGLAFSFSRYATTVPGTELATFSARLAFSVSKMEVDPANTKEIFIILVTFTLY